MRIGIDARALHGQRTGIGNWTWNLLRALPEYIKDIELVAYLPENLTCSTPREISSVFFKKSKALPLLSGHFWVRYASSRLIKHDNLDVYIAPRTVFPVGIEEYVPVITVVHDLNIIIQPKTMSMNNYLAHKLWFRKDIKRASLVICNSHATSIRLNKFIGRSADAIIPPGVDIRLETPKITTEAYATYTDHAPYLLYVGTIEPRKNIDTLLAAHRQLNRDRQDPIKLLLVGKRGWGNRHLLEDLDKGIENVVEMGFVPDEHLPTLYKNSLALIMPSLYEGFGMPAAEARAYGVHTIVTDIPELREATSNQGIFIQPTVNGIISGINQALNSKPADPCHEFTWGKSAAALADILQLATQLSEPYVH